MVKASELCGGLEWRISFPDRTWNILVPAESRVCVTLHGFVTGFLSKFWVFFQEGWDLGKSEPKKLIHGFKVGTALSLVSLFYYMRPLYEGVGGNAMVAVLTVLVVFEYTVGATLSKCMNKAGGTFLAVALGVDVHLVASQFGRKFEPIILQASVCLISAATTFSRFIPSIKERYDYGALVFILTLSLVSISSYRVEQLFELSIHRLYTIAIGSSICILTSMLLCPVWAGNELHNLTKSNMEKLAHSLDGCIAEYFKCDANADSTESGTLNKTLLGYKCVLDSRETEESLANFARWEPGHGGFDFRHPWNEYLEIGASLRSCAYCIEALKCIIDSYTQAPDSQKKHFGKLCVKLSSSSSAVLKELAVMLDRRTKSNEIGFKVLEMCDAVEEVQNAVKGLSKKPIASTMSTPEDSSPTIIPVIEIVPLVTISSLLIQIAGITENIAMTVSGLICKESIVQS